MSFRAPTWLQWHLGQLTRLGCIFKIYRLKKKKIK